MISRRGLLLGAAAALVTPKRAYSFVGGWQREGALWMPDRLARLAAIEAEVDAWFDPEGKRLITRIRIDPAPFFSAALGMNVFP